VAVVAVEGWRPRAAGELVLADALPAVGVHFLHRATNQFVQELGVVRRIQCVDQVFCGHASSCLADAVAVAVVKSDAKERPEVWKLAAADFRDPFIQATTARFPKLAALLKILHDDVTLATLQKFIDESEVRAKCL
jgi:hypothetical protein